MTSTSFPLITLQPVVDKRKAWIALLLESRPAPTADDLALIFGDFDLAAALGGLTCILSLPDLSVGVEALPLPATTVVRLPSAFCCDPANDGQLKALVAAGFRLMADGLPPPGQTPFAGVRALSLPCPGQRIPSGEIDWLGKLPGPHLALNAADMACPGRCHFQWLAGHATKPPGGPNATETGYGTLLIELLSQVVNDADTDEIEATVRRDPQLSYHLLKLVNSAAFAPNAKIASFGKAIALLGRRQLQRWLQLLLYTRAQNDGAANPLLPQAALRAGLAEALCARRGGSREMQDRAFMAGMFSLLDVLFGRPLAEIVEPLNLADDITQALIERSGPLGLPLNAVVAGEQPAGDELAALLEQANLSHEAWARSLIHACAWAVQIAREA